ncbi:MAG: RNA methyltransferase [Actinobacteria bacterium]|nr:RNA methyltransferase [Actinomycetota bacterium]
MPMLGARHAEMRRLRELVRDAGARRREGVVVLEGARVVDGALDRAAALAVVYAEPSAWQVCGALMARLHDAGVPVRRVTPGVVERSASTVTPQPVVALATRPASDIAELAYHDARRPVVVAVDVADPGNAGTLVRSAEAAEAAAMVFCGNSVDPYSPKVVRSSAGALFGIPVLEVDSPVHVLDALGAAGRRRLATVARGGEPYDECELDGPVALVLGNEARGLPASVQEHVDGAVTVPTSDASESLNVGVAGSVLLFEAARQRRAREHRGSA